MTESHAFDVLMATDLRFPGGTTASVVEETLAQNRAGYRTGLLHLPSPIQRPGDPFAPRIRALVESGAAELVLDGPVSAKVLVIRHPSVLASTPPWLPQVRAEHVLIVANQVPVDPRAHSPYYDVWATQRAARPFGEREPVWAPIGPTVREALAHHAGEVPMLATDWTNIVDVDSWHVPREGVVDRRPVIGRHSRGHWSKWPATKEEILAAYPDDPRYSVQVLGGTEAPRDVLGRLPGNWVDLPFNSVTPAQYLASIDFLVYYHHPALVEAFGRTVLEGLASGAVAVVDASFEPTFGTACVYATAGEARTAVDELSADPDAYQRQSAHGVALVRERFSYEAHARRLAELIGPAESSGETSQTSERSAEVAPEPRTLVVLPHRGDSPDSVLAALALPEDEVPVVLLTADDAPTALVRRAQVETIPEVAAGLEPGDRQRYLAARVSGIVDTCAIGRVVLAGDPDQLQADLDPTVELAMARRASAVGSRPERESSSGWEISAVRRGNTPAQAGRSLHTVARRGANLLRQRAPRPVVRMGVQAKRALRSANARALHHLAPAGALRMHPARLPRLTPPPSPITDGRPAVVFVVLDQSLAAAETTRAIMQRAVLSNAFLPVLLAPPSWIGAARKAGVAIETLVPQEEFAAPYTSRWPGYFRRRLAEVVQAFQPAAALTLATAPPGARSPVDEALDVAESLSGQRSI
ncbi:glycosyltransferase [Ruania rhizosphaerae]|uniref:glycosyltransferase n=1 Tax=Ruania rhizosphaerae TaxID=1840413 RepID=UPI00135C7738|nr:glycosyltransferase [Ruania rhizosphaerae]